MDRTKVLRSGTTGFGVDDGLVPVPRGTGTDIYRCRYPVRRRGDELGLGQITSEEANPDKISRFKHRSARPTPPPDLTVPCRDRVGAAAEADMLRRHPMGKIRWLAG